MSDSGDPAPAGAIPEIQNDSEEHGPADGGCSGGATASRSGSQDDLDPAHQEALRSAISALDAQALDELAKSGLWWRQAVLDSSKLWNPVHQLVDCYLSGCELGGATDLFRRFADCLSVMVEHGLDVNEGDIGRNTPLHLVCNQCGVEPVIRKLVESGAKVNLENANRQTALHLAADNGTSSDVETLLAAGADPNQLDCLGFGPLHIAVKYRRNRDTIKCLVACGADIDLQCSEDTRGHGSAPLHIAVRQDRKENVKLLLELGASTDVINSSGQTPLQLAAKYDVTGDMVSYLLQAGADIDYADTIYGETALHKAIRQNMTENVKALTEHGASLCQPDINGDSPLHTAAVWCQSVETWIALLNGHKPNISQRNAKKQTVIDVASRRSNKLAVSILKMMDS